MPQLAGEVLYDVGVVPGSAERAAKKAEAPFERSVAKTRNFRVGVDEASYKATQAKLARLATHLTARVKIENAGPEAVAARKRMEAVFAKPILATVRYRSVGGGSGGNEAPSYGPTGTYTNADARVLAAEKRLQATRAAGLDDILRQTLANDARAAAAKTRHESALHQLMLRDQLSRARAADREADAALKRQQRAMGDLARLGGRWSLGAATGVSGLAASVLALGANAYRSSVAVSGVTTAVLSLGTAALRAGTGVLFLTSSIGSLLRGGLIGLPGILAAAEAGFTVFRLGLSGVFSTIGQGLQAQQLMGAGSSALGKLMSQEADRARGLADAQRGLTKARADYRDEVRDLRNELQSLNVQEMSAQQRREAALLKQKQVALDPTATAFDTREAAVGVAEADQGILDVRNRRTKAEDRLGGLLRTGEDKDERVLDALDRLADANSAVANETGQAATATNLFDQQLARLSPNARAFVTTVLSLAAAWKDVRWAISDALLLGADGGIKRLSDSYLDVIERGGVRLATAFNGWGGALTDYLTGKGRERIDTSFQDIAGAAESATGGVKSTLSSVLTLTSVGTKNLRERLGPAFTDVMARFDAFLQKAETDKRLDRWLNDAETGTSNLSKGVYDLSGALGRLSTLANGGKPITPFESFAGITKDWREWLEKPANATRVQHFFDILRSASKIQFGGLAGTAGEALQTFADASLRAAPYVRQIFDDLGSFFKNNRTDISEVSGALAQFFQQNFSGFLGVLSSALPLAKDFFTELTKLGPNGEASGVTQFWEGLKGVFEDLDKNDVGTKAGAAIAAVMRTLKEIFDWLVEHEVGEKLGAVFDWISQNPGLFLAIAAGATIVMGPLKGLLDALFGAKGLFTLLNAVSGGALARAIGKVPGLGWVDRAAGGVGGSAGRSMTRAARDSERALQLAPEGGFTSRSARRAAERDIARRQRNPLDWMRNRLSPEVMGPGDRGSMLLPSRTGRLARGAGRLVRGGGLVGLAAGIAGGVAGDAIAGDFSNGGIRQTGGKVLANAATGAGIGATIGSIIPGVGTVAGGVVGGAVGGGIALFKNANWKQIRKEAAHTWKDIKTGAWAATNVASAKARDLKNSFVRNTAEISAKGLGKFTELKNGAAQRVGGVLSAVSDMRTRASERFSELADNARGNLGRITDLVKSGDWRGALSAAWDTLKDGFRGVLNTIIKWWNAFELKIPGADGLAGDVLSALGPLGKVVAGGISLKTPDLPMLEKGGVYKGAAIVGENGAEMHLGGGKSGIAVPLEHERDRIRAVMGTDVIARQQGAQSEAIAEGLRELKAAITSEHAADRQQADSARRTSDGQLRALAATLAQALRAGKVSSVEAGAMLARLNVVAASGGRIRG